MDFDKIIDRRGTGCVKYDGLKPLFGRDDLIPLWVADMDFEVSPAITEALRKCVDRRIYGYHRVPDSYLRSITSWLRRRHGFEVAEDEVCYVPGVVRGVCFAIDRFSREGDKILIQPPVYHPFRIVAEGNGRKVVDSPLTCGDGKMRMDLELLEKTVAEEKPAMMVLCNPHNPGGVVWDKATLRQVAEICARHSVVVVSDEIHGDLELFGNRYTPFASVSETAASISVTLGAPSKTFNIPGIVSSWCVVKNPSLRRRLFTHLEVNELSQPPMFVTAATEAAYNESEPWLDEAIAYIEGNVRYVEGYLSRRLPAIKPLRPQASYLIWLDCTATGLRGKELNSLFVDRARLALNDGEMFGQGGERHMRLNAGCPRATLEKAMARLSEAFAEIGLEIREEKK